VASEPDRALVERMMGGDERALAEVYDRHGGPAYSLALAIVGERGTKRNSPRARGCGVSRLR